jgi:probable O-glycosylation ligase (exosortase A-associated)
MEKQFIMMVFITAVGVIGGIGFGPYVAMLVYYLNAILRPQNMWSHIASVRDVQWSFTAAIVALVTAVIYRLGLLGYQSCGVTKGARTPLWNIVHWCMVGFALHITIRHLLTLTYGNTSENIESERSYTEYIKMIVMFFVASLVIYRLNQLWILLAVIALADAYVAYEVNMNYLVLGYNRIQRSGYGGLDNNGAGLMMAMGIPLCYFLWEGTLGKFRWVYLMFVPVLMHAVQLSFSRGAMVATLISVPIVFLFSRHKKWLLLMGTVGFIGVLATSGPELRDRFLSIKQHDLDASANSRKLTWSIAMNLANQHPFFGLGLRCSKLQMKTFGADENQAIHSQYFQLAADTGWMGVGWFIAVVAAVIWTCYRTWRKTRLWLPYPEVIRTRAMAGAVSSSLVLYCVGAAFLSLDTFELPYILMMIVAQLWGVYTGGGVEATIQQSGSQLPSATLKPMVQSSIPILPRRTVPPGNRQSVSVPVPGDGRYQKRW